MAYQQQGQAPKHITNEIAYADPFRLFPQSLFMPYNPSALVGRKGYRIIDQMAKDEQVKVSLQFKVNAVMAAGWQVVSPEDKGDDWEVAGFVRDALSSLSGTLDDKISGIIYDGILYGHALAEKIYDKDLNLVDIKSIRPHEIHYVQDVYGNVTEIQQERPEGRIALQPTGKFIRWNYHGRHQNPYGQSEMEAVYRAYWSKRNVYNWLGMLLERFGIPPVFLFYNPDAFKGGTLDQLQQVMKNIQASTYALIPRRGGEENLQPWTPELAAKVNDVFLPALDRYDRDIAKAMLMPQMMGLTPETEDGSYARSKVSFDVFLLTLDQLRASAEESIINEQIVKPLVDLHFSVDEYPEVKLNPVTENQAKEVLSSWSQLVSSNSVTPTLKDQIHIRELLEFPEQSEKELEAEQEKREKKATEIAVENKKDSEKKKPKTDKTELVQLSAAAKRVKAKSIGKQLDALELSLATGLNKGLSLSLAKVASGIKRRGVKATLDSLPDLLDNSAKRAVAHTLAGTLRAGRQSLLDELEGVAEAHVFRPLELLSDALNFMLQRAMRIVSTVNSDALTAVRDSLLSSLKLGETAREAEGRLSEAVTPFVSAGVVDQAQLIPSRLEVIVRTETTNAYNMGRLLAGRTPGAEKIMAGWEYSAILDSRTTAICRRLDGRFIAKGDPDLARLSPPNHFNCRSLLVPVTIIDDPGEPISPSEKGQIFELAGKGFV